MSAESWDDKYDHIYGPNDPVPAAASSPTTREEPTPEMDLEKVKVNRDYWMTQCQDAWRQRDDANAMREVDDKELARLNSEVERLTRVVEAANRIDGIITLCRNLSPDVLARMTDLWPSLFAAINDLRAAADSPLPRNQKGE